jgi:rod shape-determining protein MreC
MAEENAQLKAERDRLRQWQAAAQRLEAENASLKALLDYVPDPGTTVRTARVVANSTSAFAHSVVVAAGANDGIEKGQIAVTGDGLIGRVAAVSPRAALVLLITDLNSRVPVHVGPSRIQAVLAGDNSERPKLVHRVGDGVINVGDEVVTSGVAGGFPPAQPIGLVEDAASTAISVRPFVDRNRLEYLRLVRYEVPPAPMAEAPHGKGRAAPRGQPAAAGGP